ncbi:MAG: hypothetical protein A2Y57_04830 [Candidatus Woykebacteria bacterium RBG_13_40_7b]|uniref:Uncharacterized protein n=1 Tax=Candidatus Woykebacteria bacterium RBG_13_40_7b TaxID=1802594 RepID=A0A1G1WBT7_9BACT|nr:MAG: hypothetical protein A2Y57_04830 [Candidatus Woykebacteria bacterium RBG_13_40_7b]
MLALVFGFSVGGSTNKNLALTLFGSSIIGAVVFGGLFWKCFNDYLNADEAKDEAFHRRRRMFCIIGDEVKIAPEGVPWSHSQWFAQEDWTQGDRNLIEHVVRGFVLDDNLWFYVGLNFVVPDWAERIMLAKLGEVADLLKLSDFTKVHAGPKDRIGEGTHKYYGRVGDLTD